MTIIFKALQHPFHHVLTAYSVTCRDDPENCFCVGHHCMKEPWECHTSADCAKLDKCKELEEGRGCSCVDSTCESQCATKVSDAELLMLYSQQESSCL